MLGERLGQYIKVLLGITDERRFLDRMDGCDLESRPWMHQGQRRMQTLLRGDVRGEMARDTGSPIRTGIRSPAGAGEAKGSLALVSLAASVRELDERSFPEGRAGVVRVQGLPNHELGRLAHLPVADEASPTDEEATSPNAKA